MNKLPKHKFVIWKNYHKFRKKQLRKNRYYVILGRMSYNTINPVYRGRFRIYGVIYNPALNLYIFGIKLPDIGKYLMCYRNEPIINGYNKEITLEIFLKETS